MALRKYTWVTFAVVFLFQEMHCEDLLTRICRVRCRYGNGGNLCGCQASHFNGKRSDPNFDIWHHRQRQRTSNSHDSVSKTSSKITTLLNHLIDESIHKLKRMDNHIKSLGTVSESNPSKATPSRIAVSRRAVGEILSHLSSPSWQTSEIERNQLQGAAMDLDWPQTPFDFRPEPQSGPIRKHTSRVNAIWKHGMDHELAGTGTNILGFPESKNSQYDTEVNQNNEHFFDIHDVRPEYAISKDNENNDGDDTTKSQTIDDMNTILSDMLKKYSSVEERRGSQDMGSKLSKVGNKDYNLNYKDTIIANANDLSGHRNLLEAEDTEPSEQRLFSSPYARQRRDDNQSYSRIRRQQEKAIISNQDTRYSSLRNVDLLH